MIETQGMHTIEQTLKIFTFYSNYQCDSNEDVSGGLCFLKGPPPSRRGHCCYSYGRA